LRLLEACASLVEDILAEGVLVEGILLAGILLAGVLLAGSSQAYPDKAANPIPSSTSGSFHPAGANAAKNPYSASPAKIAGHAPHFGGLGRHRYAR
jgi:hypothetical protein